MWIRLFLIILLLVAPAYGGWCEWQIGDSTEGENNYWREKRFLMVEGQLEERFIKDEKVLEVMRNVKRHRFVPPAFRSYAYDDSPLPIGFGQTISQPFIVAYMTQMIQPQENFKVLEIGTGSGYQAAILSGLVDQVFTIEIIPTLAQNSSKLLKQEGYSNVTVKEGDGYHGWPDEAPFDAIIVTAAAEFIPPPLIEQLREGGKMIIPVGSPFFVQRLMLLEKVNGKILSRNLMAVRFVPFRRAK